MPGKAKPAPGAMARASGSVVAGDRNSQKNTPNTDEQQAVTEREIYSGRDFLGLVRERSDGQFVAVVGENIVGAFPTITAATDKVIELGRAGARP